MEEAEGSCCKGLTAFFEKSKPALAMISVQFGFAGMNIISKAAINQGMSHFVLVVYRHAVATLVLVPFAYVLERKSRPVLTFRVFVEIFLSALFGSTLNQNFYYAALGYTSPTFACALSNMVPAVTFLMAIPFGLERVGIRSLAGQAKVLGTLICVGGAMLMTLYKGIPITLWSSPFDFSQGKGNGNGSGSENLTKGSLLLVASCISWSSWFILQAKLSRRYSAKYTSTALMCFLATIQSAVLTLIFERDHPSVWAIGWDIKLLTSVYSGVVASGIAFCIMTWCIGRKGPLFVTMFSPLLLIIVAVMSSIILDEKLHLGSVIGSLLIVGGLYAVVWGKAKEMGKIVKIPKKDADESCNSQELSGHSRYATPNNKELIINTQLKNDDNHHQEKELAASKMKKATRETEEICCGRELTSVGNHIAIDCSAFDGDGLHGDDRTVCAGEASTREGKREVTTVSKV